MCKNRMLLLLPLRIGPEQVKISWSIGPFSISVPICVWSLTGRILKYLDLRPTE